MADVLQKVISGNGIVNGSAVVTVTPLPNTAKTRLDPPINQTAQVTAVSGVLDSRFDDVNYYTA
jgi:hypothetical protein